MSEVKQTTWNGVSTDLSSFNSFGVVTLSDGQRVNVQMTMRHGFNAENLYSFSLFTEKPFDESSRCGADEESLQDSDFKLSADGNLFCSDSIRDKSENEKEQDNRHDSFELRFSLRLLTQISSYSLILSVRRLELTLEREGLLHRQVLT